MSSSVLFEWWFFDNPTGMRHYRRLVTETAGFYNVVGFNDDTRAFLTIPAISMFVPNLLMK